MVQEVKICGLVGSDVTYELENYFVRLNGFGLDGYMDVIWVS